MQNRYSKKNQITFGNGNNNYLVVIMAYCIYILTNRRRRLEMFLTNDKLGLTWPKIETPYIWGKNIHFTNLPPFNDRIWTNGKSSNRFSNFFPSNMYLCKL